MGYIDGKNFWAQIHIRLGLGPKTTIKLRKKIGTILGGQKEGKIRFDEAFLQEHPEFRNYQVERKGKDYVFTPISE
ncbi:hypothetical protein, partial [Parasutterella excrementihominis]|uniref:hypothetical protein n=1 Tax=Parasutterella excrementihominis TaxID=487175 RepID=UPI003A95632C